MTSCLHRLPVLVIQLLECPVPDIELFAPVRDAVWWLDRAHIRKYSGYSISVGARYTPETCRVECFTHDLLLAVVRAGRCNRTSSVRL